MWSTLKSHPKTFPQGVQKDKNKSQIELSCSHTQALTPKRSLLCLTPLPIIPLLYLQVLTKISLYSTLVR